MGLFKCLHKFIASVFALFLIFTFVFPKNIVFAETESPPISTNIVLNKTFSITNEYAGSQSFANALDGDVNTAWETPYVGGNTITFDFGKAHIINKFKFFWGDQYALN